MHTMPPTETDRVASRLVDLCRKGQYMDAMRDLYGDNCRHVEAMVMPGCEDKAVVEGKAALLKMGEQWGKTTTVHSSTVSNPRVNNDQFIVEMAIDCTSSEGPMAGQRMQMSEYCLYTVKNGKITEAKFFYGHNA
jgi:ketosteroid isomerase-like protein